MRPLLICHQSPTTCYFSTQLATRMSEVICLFSQTLSIFCMTYALCICCDFLTFSRQHHQKYRVDTNKYESFKHEVYINFYMDNNETNHMVFFIAQRSGVVNLAYAPCFVSHLLGKMYLTA
jgi:hypothetical protein